MVHNLSRRRYFASRLSRLSPNFKSPRSRFAMLKRKIPIARRFIRPRSPRTYRVRQNIHQPRASSRPNKYIVHTELPEPRGVFPPQFELEGPYVTIPTQVSSPSPPYPQIFQPTYVLSIRPERMQEFLRRMGSWSMYCKRGNCVVGSTLDKNKMLRTNVINTAGSKLKLGQIGCWLSHFNAWQCIADAPYEYGTIFEDDVGFSNSTQISLRVQEAMAELESTSTPWDVLYWCVLPFPHVAAGLKECQLKNWFVAPPNHCLGCIAYTIKKSVAQLWLSRAKPIHNPVDNWVTESFDRLRAFCIKPILGFMVPSFSDTENQRKPGYLRYLK